MSKLKSGIRIFIGVFSWHKLPEERTSWLNDRILNAAEIVEKFINEPLSTATIKSQRLLLLTSFLTLLFLKGILDPVSGNIFGFPVKMKNLTTLALIMGVLNIYFMIIYFRGYYRDQCLWKCKYPIFRHKFERNIIAPCISKVNEIEKNIPVIEKQIEIHEKIDDDEISLKAFNECQRKIVILKSEAQDIVSFLRYMDNLITRIQVIHFSSATLDFLLPLCLCVWAAISAFSF